MCYIIGSKLVDTITERRLDHESYDLISGSAHLSVYNLIAFWESDEG